MPLTQFRVDDGPHNMDGLRLLAQDGTEQVEAFIGRKVMDVWADSVGAGFNRQHPFVEVLFSDITESGEALDLSELVREPLPPAFHRLT
jgi:hypothetical protein